MHFSAEFFNPFKNYFLLSFRVLQLLLKSGDFLPLFSRRDRPRCDKIFRVERYGTRSGSRCELGWISARLREPARFARLMTGLQEKNKWVPGFGLWPMLRRMAQLRSEIGPAALFLGCGASPASCASLGSRRRAVIFQGSRRRTESCPFLYLRAWAKAFSVFSSLCGEFFLLMTGCQDKKRAAGFGLRPMLRLRRSPIFDRPAAA